MKQCRHCSGQCYLPDKEFRYLRTVHDVRSTREKRVFREALQAFGGLDASCISLCRSDCIIGKHRASLRVAAWRAVSEDSLSCNDPPWIVHMTESLSC
jgi:hypothetical protein